MKLSLIMPAYNSQKTISQAIESTLNQKYEIEIIIIDDGSNDDTLKICQKLQQSHNNIKVFHQKNSGVSVARNFGLKMATGEYVAFIDSDDSLKKEYTDKIFNIINSYSVDFILFGYSKVKENNRIGGWIPNQTENSSDMISHFFDNWGGLNPLWNKVFRRELITKEFNIKKNMGEDLEFVCEYLKGISNVIVIQDELYLYKVDSENSLTKNVEIVVKSIVEDIRILKNLVEYVGLDDIKIVERFYRRTEGILNNVTDSYTNFCNVTKMFNTNYEYMRLLEEYNPHDLKSKFIRAMFVKHYERVLYYFLKAKSLLRVKMQRI